MPLEVAVWRIDETLQRVEQTQLNLESRLQDLLDEDITIANPGWMVIGREVITEHGGRIDILAIDAAATLVVAVHRHQAQSAVRGQLEPGTPTSSIFVRSAGSTACRNSGSGACFR